jgi:hypothetical protein
MRKKNLVFLLAIALGASVSRVAKAEGPTPPVGGVSDHHGTTPIAKSISHSHGKTFVGATTYAPGVFDDGGGPIIYPGHDGNIHVKIIPPRQPVTMPQP